MAIQFQYNNPQNFRHSATLGKAPKKTEQPSAPINPGFNPGEDLGEIQAGGVLCTTAYIVVIITTFADHFLTTHATSIS